MNKYLNIKTQPDLLIKYQSQTDRYSFSILNSQWFKNNIEYESRLGYFSEIYKPYIIGWVASAKHPNQPIKVAIYFGVWTLEQKDIKDIIINSDFVTLYHICEYENELYTPMHDLFIYKGPEAAILAGCEMKEIDNINNKKQSDMKENNYFTNKLNELLNNPKIKECYNNLNDAVEDFLNDEKTIAAQNTIKKTYNEAKNFAIDTTEKFLSRLLNDIKDINNNADYTTQKADCGNHTFVKVVKVGDKSNKIILSKSYANNHKVYSIKINNVIKNIDKEQYEDLYAVLTNCINEKPEYIMNSVYDVIQPVKDEPEAKKAEKKYPIQFCQFRAEDEVEHEPQPNKQKFQVGDKAYNKTYGYGTIVGISDARTRDGKKRKLYRVQFGENKLNVWSAWSYELEKA